MNIMSSPALGSSILNCVLLDQKHIYEAYKQVLSSKTQNSISLWMWASSEANAALRDIVMRFAELEILVVKLLQGYMKKFVEHRRVLKQVVEEEHNVTEVRNQHLDYSKKAAKLSAKVDQHAKKRDSTKLKNLKNELQIARSHEEEKKEQLDAAVLRLEVLKASLVRNSLVMISDAGVRLAQGMEKISLGQHKVSKMIPVIPVHLATPTPNNPTNTSCYPGADVTNNLVENLAQEIGIVRSTPQECSHLCEPLFKRAQYQTHGSSSFYNYPTSSAISNNPLARLNLAPPPYSPPSPGLQRDYSTGSQQTSGGVHTCRRMNRMKYYQNRESSYNSDGASPRMRSGKFTDAYDEIHSDEATFDLNDSDFEQNFETIDFDQIRRSRSQTDAVTGAASNSIVTTPFSSEKQFSVSPSGEANDPGTDQEVYSQPLRWDPANLLKDAASTNKIFASVYNQMNEQVAHCEMPNCSQEPYLNLINKCNPNCERCSSGSKEDTTDLSMSCDRTNRMSAAEFDALKRRDGMKVRSGSLHAQTMLTNRLKRQQHLQSHSGSVDLNLKMRDSTKKESTHVVTPEARASKTGSEIEKASNCSLEHVDLMSHMLDTFFSVEESEHFETSAAEGKQPENQSNAVGSSVEPDCDDIHPPSGLPLDRSAVETPQHSVTSGEEGIYSNLNHTWSSAPSLPDSCRSCMCRNCVEAASNEGVLGADDAQIDDAVFDDQCSNSYVNYSNSRLREYSMFWAAAESDSDNKRNPAYEELQTLHSDDGRKSGLEETLDRVSQRSRNSNSGSLNDNLDEADETSTVQRRPAKATHERSPLKSPSKVSSKAEESQATANSQERQANSNGSEGGADGQEFSIQGGTRDEVGIDKKPNGDSLTPQDKPPTTPSTNKNSGGYSSQQMRRPPNKFGIRKALFRLKNSRLSTSEPNLFKK
ncbi:uncharacterized protein LOC134842887 isoform X2 [Symsagittifera roscoffensis]|uniref:uncharacterized protein LOC134842887 isoform X2 n=1 Tax=Symsagittifera roscoffensis TaxID=84072 RepID=UPI00307C5EFA